MNFDEAVILSHAETVDEVNSAPPVLTFFNGLIFLRLKIVWFFEGYSIRVCSLALVLYCCMFWVMLC